MSDDEEDFHREYERARRNDAGRRGGPARAVPTPPAGGYTRCMDCGREGARMRTAPAGGLLVCTGVFEGQPAADVSCYERLERKQTDRNGEEYRMTKKVISEAKERNSLTDSDKAFLRTIAGGQDSIDALEARFKRIKGDAPKGKTLKKGDW